ncbi:HdeA/HdeB family chaperone [Mastigocoleus testarum]|uniref:Uncharacterized protein n=1 Tax=Mastigocoleus testarum BC008 TaxID=371196 RepID=A0A0V7ZYB4_9CYAN|nr:HdeA/HdeB family chaperone [Mastigocoleus testarum]KST69307.1 hypothetical protein BC008_03720 [Mastigocoleus testarum BC008]KST69345.1 hypothetical protein BC008_03920 [Mastigocoleus testarum BC008]
MKRFIWILLFGVIAFGNLSIPAQAQSSPNTNKLAQSSPNANEDDSVDLKALTCRQLLLTDGEERSNLMIFMHGFMSGKKNNLTIDAPALTKVTDKIVNSCIDSPNSKLLGVFEKNR